MRRLLALLLVPLLFLAGCSAPGSASTGFAAITVSGEPGAAPSVDGITGVTTDAIVSRVPVAGTGEPIDDGDFVDVHYVLYRAVDGSELYNSYEAGPNTLNLDSANDPLLSAQVKGQKLGSRVLIAAPASEVYGEDSANAGVDPTETLVLVVELISKFAAPAVTGTIDDVQVVGGFGETPQVSAKQGLVVAETQSRVLVEGAGEKVAVGDQVTVNYVGVNGRSGETFDSSFERGQTVDFTLDTSVIGGFVTGLADKTIGSRVLITVPYTDGYGTTAVAEAGIEGGDTLIFVVDLVAKIAS